MDILSNLKYAKAIRVMLTLVHLMYMTVIPHRLVHDTAKPTHEIIIRPSPSTYTYSALQVTHSCSAPLLTKT